MGVLYRLADNALAVLSSRYRQGPEPNDGSSCDHEEASFLPCFCTAHSVLHAYAGASALAARAADAFASRALAACI